MRTAGPESFMTEIPSSCPRCGARNASGAWMCWRCNSTLVTLPQPPPVSPPPAATTMVSPQLSSPVPPQGVLDPAQYDLSLLSSPRRSVRTRQPILWAMVIVSVGLLIVAPIVTKGIVPSSSVTLPDSIGGYRRVDGNPEADRRKEEISKAAFEGHLAAAVEAYVQPGKALIVEVFSGAVSDASAGSVLSAIVDPLRNQRVTVITSQETRTFGENGVTQACAPMTGDLNGSICSWSDLRRVGLVYGINVDVQENGSLTEAVRRAIAD